MAAPVCIKETTDHHYIKEHYQKRERLSEKFLRKVFLFRKLLLTLQPLWLSKTGNFLWLMISKVFQNGKEFE